MTDFNNAYCNLIDVYKTLKSHNLLHLKRVHGGTENEDTIGDLLEDTIEEMKMDFNWVSLIPCQLCWRGISFYISMGPRPQARARLSTRVRP